MVTAFRLPEKVAPLFTALPQIDELLSSDASIQVVVLGGGTLLEYFAEKVAQTRNYRRISMPGHIHNTEDWYLRARGLLHVSGLDAYPSVVNEARAYGLPVVVTPSVGMKEQVRDRIDGLLLDDTLTNLQEAWRLLSDPHFWQELSSEGRERVRRENDPIRVGRQFREAIEEFLS
jgi:glycosyltransferase involved in cell wall biosynthesis